MKINCLLLSCCFVCAINAMDRRELVTPVLGQPLAALALTDELMIDVGGLVRMREGDDTPTPQAKRRMLPSDPASPITRTPDLLSRVRRYGVDIVRQQLSKEQASAAMHTFFVQAVCEGDEAVLFELLSGSSVYAPYLYMGDVRELYRSIHGGAFSVSTRLRWAVDSLAARIAVNRPHLPLPQWFDTGL